MLNRNLFAALALLFAAGALWVGCSVGFDPGNAESGVFYCESEADCLDEGYRCNTDTNRCVSTTGGGGNPDCDSSEGGIDQDGDGYGTGQNRQDCVDRCVEAGGDQCNQRSVEDCDDSDPEVYPGAPELCDGKVNNCLLMKDTEADAFSCNGSSDSCPELADEPEGVASNFVNVMCEGGQCVYYPLNQNPCKVDDMVVKLTCTNSTNYSWVRDSTKGYSDLPEDCQ